MFNIRIPLLFSLIPLVVSAGNFKYSGFFQLRFDYGDLLKTENGYSKRGDLYLRRFEFKTEYLLREQIKLVSKLAVNNLFRNYKSGKEYNYPKKVLIKKLFLQLEPSNYLTLKVGRDKKPYSGEGLSSSSKLLLLDKSYLFRKIKKGFGDYYANQLEVMFKIPQKGLRFSIATSYAWHFKTRNPLVKKYPVSLKRYWFNNLFFRFEFVPKPLKGDLKSLNTFGGKTFRLGASYGYVEDLELKTSKGNFNGVARLSEMDLFYRSPKTDKGIFTLYGEVDKLSYTFGGSVKNYYLEGFEVQGGYRPPLVFKGIKTETALGFEKITTHPGSKTDYIYEGNVNFYFPKEVKLTLGVSDKVSSGKAQEIYSLQFQWTF